MEVDMTEETEVPERKPGTTFAFSVAYADYSHLVAASENDDCNSCWSSDWPKKCSDPECKGYVHTEFGEENYDGDYWLNYCCDQCGSTDSPE
jgi:hypothetical protein